MTEGAHQIIVGVDGSDASKSALRWAVEEARLRGATVVVLHAWRIPIEYGMYEGMVIPKEAPEELEKAAQETVRAAIADVVGSDASVPIVVSVRSGPASKVLVDASEDADLLVVGSEGHGAFAGVLLGSVSMHVVHHARCPVTVVRPGWPTVAAA